MDLDFVYGGDLSHGVTPPVGENIFGYFLALFSKHLKQIQVFFFEVAGFPHDRNN